MTCIKKKKKKVFMVNDNIWCVGVRVRDSKDLNYGVRANIWEQK